MYNNMLVSRSRDVIFALVLQTGQITANRSKSLQIAGNSVLKAMAITLFYKSHRKVPPKMKLGVLRYTLLAIFGDSFFGGRHIFFF